MVTVAVIGCGRISKGAHFPVLQQIEDVRIKYACDILLEKAQWAKENFPKIEKVTSDYKEVLADKEVEAVFVLTPNYMHYQVTMDALRAGKHVLCEKPITINYELSVEMAKEAKKQGKILDIGVCNRYHRSVEILRDYVKEGKFGNIYHTYISFRANRNIPGLGGAFTTKEISGGGVLIDSGIHLFDIALYVLGGATVKTATCDTYNVLAKDMPSYKYKYMWAKDTSDVVNGTNDVEEFVSGYVRTDKSNISFNGAWAQNLEKTEVYIDFLGDKGGARFNYQGGFEFFNGETLETETPEFEMPNSWLMEDIAFINAIQNGGTNPNNIESVLETMKLLDILYKSAEMKKEIEL